MSSTTLFSAAALVLAAVAGPTSCQPGQGRPAPAPTAPTTRPHHTAVNPGEFATSCDGHGRPFNVRPNTPAARAWAAKACAHLERGLNDAGW
ncbi:hypothetical protein M8C13_40415 [Crossiella sp. SN42]|uniref:hypothetical protein n=1 Tax=Crossiella sp. SN42 TaxID=2944808 RepID=UPI00207D21A8|nr:hypothetical protein [Crossiella sp. SN42]MCO1582032.1 hypothetical protein [Crossiella sp. SN42]